VSTKLGSLSFVWVQLGAWKLSVIQSSGVSAVQVLLNIIEVSVRTVGTFGIVRYIMGVCSWGASVKQSSIVLVWLCLRERNWAGGCSHWLISSSLHYLDTSQRLCKGGLYCSYRCLPQAQLAWDVSHTPSTTSKSECPQRSPQCLWWPTGSWLSRAHSLALACQSSKGLIAREEVVWRQCSNCIHYIMACMQQELLCANMSQYTLKVWLLCTFQNSSKVCGGLLSEEGTVRGRLGT